MKKQNNYQKKLKELNIEDIKELYESGVFIKDIAIKYGVTKYRILSLMKRNKCLIKRGINRKRSVDISFFENINTNIKAYVIGLICSDGSIDKDGYGFQLVSKDNEILEKFKEILKSEHKICKVESYDKRTNKIYVRYSIHICSKKMVEDLKKIGLNNNKSFTCKMPKINEEYFWDFLRGLFDGDGCVTGRNGKLRISFIASVDIMNNIKKIFNKNNLSDNKLTVQSKNEYGIIYNLKQNSYKDILLIRELLYKSVDIDNPYYLTRKYNKLQELKEYKLGKLAHKNKIWKKILFLDKNEKIIFNSIKECCYSKNLILKSVYESIRKNINHKGYTIKYLE